MCVATSSLAGPVSSTSLPSSSSSSTSLPSLSGLQPRVYLQKRNHDPDVLADLRALPARERVDVALALLAAPDDALPLAPDVDYPAGLAKDERARLRALEVRAARTGALVVLGDVADAADPRALPALVRALDHDDVHIAAVAAERLGQHGLRRATGVVDVVDVLSRVANAGARDVVVRAGACAGLGRHRGDDAERALDALLSIVADKATPADVVVAALQATANLGSSWAWQAHGDVARGAALRAKARTALLGSGRDDGAGPVAAARAAALARLR